MLHPVPRKSAFSAASHRRKALPLRVQRDVGPVIVEEIHLNLPRFGRSMKRISNIPVVWTNQFRMLVAVEIYGFDGFKCQQARNALFGFRESAFSRARSVNRPMLR